MITGLIVNDISSLPIYKTIAVFLPIFIASLKVAESLTYGIFHDGTGLSQNFARGSIPSLTLNISNFDLGTVCLTYSTQFEYIFWKFQILYSKWNGMLKWNVKLEKSWKGKVISFKGLTFSNSNGSLQLTRHSPCYIFLTSWFRIQTPW